MPREKLTRQQKTFVNQYVKTGNQSYAATRAGYGSPAVRASELLTKPNVAEAIAARMATREQIERAGPLCSADLVERLEGRRGGPMSHGEAAKLHSVYWKVWSQLPQEKSALDLDVDSMSPEQLKEALPVLRAELARIEGRQRRKLEEVESRLADQAIPVQAVEVVRNSAPKDDEGYPGDDVFA